jgi:hypothetical protein
MIVLAKVIVMRSTYSNLSKTINQTKNEERYAGLLAS